MLEGFIAEYSTRRFNRVCSDYTKILEVAFGDHDENNAARTQARVLRACCRAHGLFASEQIVLCSMDPRYCILLALGIYMELWSESEQAPPTTSSSVTPTMRNLPRAKCTKL